MKKKLWLILGVAAIIATLWFAFAEKTEWWATLILVPCAYGCLYWAVKSVKKTWLIVLLAILGIVVLRIAVLHALYFFLGIWLGIFSVAWAIVSWAFGNMGLLGGAIILILVILLIKKIIS